MLKKEYNINFEIEAINIWIATNLLNDVLYISLVIKSLDERSAFLKFLRKYKKSLSILCYSLNFSIILMGLALGVNMIYVILGSTKEGSDI